MSCRQAKELGALALGAGLLNLSVVLADVIITSTIREGFIYAEQRGPPDRAVPFRWLSQQAQYGGPGPGPE